MTTLHIEHPITDFAAWKAAFDRFEDQRRNRGVRTHRIQQPINDPRYVVIDLDFATTAEAEEFLEFLRTVVWTSPEKSPALDGTPSTLILQPPGP
ncbi:MAG: hypothetical protein QOE19_1436 [Actinomycetota bacterium]|jgi:hypothetical protein|nr:hypothetical protein [Actinomycetota bacterium]MDQ1667272.1 hypothetical protein [Actinomycetota bacterium]